MADEQSTDPSQDDTVIEERSQEPPPPPPPPPQVQAQAGATRAPGTRTPRRPSSAP